VTTIVLLMPQSHRESVFSAASLARLKRCGTVVVAPSTHYEDPLVRDLLASADVLVTGTGTPKLPHALLSSATGLRAIVHTAGTLRPLVDIDAYDLGLQISSQAPTNALPVAEYALAMILLELKGVHGIERIYRATRGEIDVDGILAGSGNFGRRVGIVSASSIGRRVIELLRPFDLEVVVYDPFLSRADASALGAAKVGLNDLLSTCDLVSLHAPLLPETVGLIGDGELALLRDGAVLVNTARGALIDQPALERQLSTGRFRAVIDVTDPEVPEPDSPLWDLPNIVLTPHVAGSRGLELLRIGDEAVAEVERLERGEPLRFGVPRARYATNA
jgi:phosphoglycerate dehydrogenase-like enzyme